MFIGNLHSLWLFLKFLFRIQIYFLRSCTSSIGRSQTLISCLFSHALNRLRNRSLILQLQFCWWMYPFLIGCCGCRCCCGFYLYCHYCVGSCNLNSDFCFFIFLVCISICGIGNVLSFCVNTRWWRRAYFCESLEVCFVWYESFSSSIGHCAMRRPSCLLSLG